MRDVKELRLAGRGEVGNWVNGSLDDKKVESKTSPTKNAAGNVSGVVLNNSCPKSQKAVKFACLNKFQQREEAADRPWRRSEAMTFWTGQPSATAFLASFPTRHDHKRVEL